MFDLEKAGVWLDGKRVDRQARVKGDKYSKVLKKMGRLAFYPITIGEYEVLVLTDEMSRVEFDSAEFLNGMGDSKDQGEFIVLDVEMSTVVDCCFKGVNKVKLSHLEGCLLDSSRLELVRGVDPAIAVCGFDFQASEVIKADFNNYSHGRILYSTLTNVVLGIGVNEIFINTCYLADVELVGKEFRLVGCTITESSLCANKYWWMANQNLHDWELEVQYLNVENRWQGFVIDLCNSRYYAFTGVSPAEGFHLAMDKGEDGGFAASNSELLWESVLEELQAREEPMAYAELDYIKECIASRMKLLEMAYKHEHGIPLSDELVTISPMAAVE